MINSLINHQSRCPGYEYGFVYIYIYRKKEKKKEMEREGGRDELTR